MKPKKSVDKIIIKLVGDVFPWHYTSAECKTSYASKCEAVHSVLCTYDIRLFVATLITLSKNL